MRSRFVRIVHPYLQPIGGVAVGGGLDTSPPYAFKYLYYLRGPQRKSEKSGSSPVLRCGGPRARGYECICTMKLRLACVETLLERCTLRKGVHSSSLLFRESRLGLLSQEALRGRRQAFAALFHLVES